MLHDCASYGAAVYKMQERSTIRTLTPAVSSYCYVLKLRIVCLSVAKNLYYGVACFV